MPEWPVVGGAAQRGGLVGALAVALLWPTTAGAVFTFFGFGTPRSITLQVGAAGATINQVTFNVTGAAVSPSPVPVVGVPDDATPTTSPAGGVRVRMRGVWPSGTATLQLTVDSSAMLACVGGTGCGATSIPFSTISWTAFETDVTSPTADIQSGAFNGSAAQTLATFSCCAGTGTVEMANTLVFSYANSTLFPAGQYRGRVVFTATLI